MVPLLGSRGAGSTAALALPATTRIDRTAATTCTAASTTRNALPGRRHGANASVALEALHRALDEQSVHSASPPLEISSTISAPRPPGRRETAARRPWAERFHVLDEPGGEGAAHGHDVEVQPLTRDDVRAIVTGPGARRAARILAVFVPVTWFGLDSQATGAYEPPAQPVEQALRARDELRTQFVIDANRNGMATAFDHKKHEVELQKAYGIAEKQTCAKCHHLNLPKDNNTSCRRCHRDMKLPTTIFSLERHRGRFESEAAYEKFLAVDLGDRRQAREACMGCHDKPEQKMVGLAELGPKGLDPAAPGFEQAMHGSCLTCHRLREQEKNEDPASPKSRGNCLFCHRDWADAGLFDEEEHAALLPADQPAPPAAAAGEP